MAVVIGARFASGYTTAPSPVKCQERREVMSQLRHIVRKLIFILKKWHRKRSGSGSFKRPNRRRCIKGAARLDGIRLIPGIRHAEPEVEESPGRMMPDPWLHISQTCSFIS